MPTISKGSVLSADVATVLTAMAEVISIDHSGAESETFKYTNLNTSGAGHEYLATGYSEGGTVDAEIWFLPATASQQILPTKSRHQQRWLLTSSTGRSRSPIRAQRLCRSRSRALALVSPLRWMTVLSYR
jgi:hypothetical protein